MNDTSSSDQILEPLPEFDTLSDEALKTLIDKLERDENEVSYQRRLLQGRIDILRAERTARLKGKGVGDVDLDRLTDILSSRETPEANLHRTDSSRSDANRATPSGGASGEESR